MQIRKEKPSDYRAIFNLTAKAFAEMPYSDGSEPKITDGLRTDNDLTLSLVAEEGKVIIGQITFSPVTINGQNDQWYGLGPVSVAIDKQRKGIGSALIREGLAQIKALGANGCVLVGNPAYYHRFGFISDGKLVYPGVQTQYVQWLSFDGSSPCGKLEYSLAFSKN